LTLSFCSMSATVLWRFADASSTQLLLPASVQFALGRFSTTMENQMLKNKEKPERKKLVLEKLPILKLEDDQRDNSNATAQDAAAAIARFSTKSTCEGTICA
jgi:hypothetical protein